MSEVITTSDERDIILVVDDAPDNLVLMQGLLKDLYRVKGARNGERALIIANTEPRPDLILLDVMMPDMDGYEVCRSLQANPLTAGIPVIFLTGMADEDDEARGMELGAVDYIVKPVTPRIVHARIKTHLALKRVADFLRDESAYLTAEVIRRTREVEALQDVTVVALASLAETRDNETGNHLRRTQHYVRCLAKQLQSHPLFAELLTDAYIHLLFKSAPLHDIGKVGIPDHILLKPGKLDPREFEIMKTHTTLGRDAIARAERELGQAVPFLQVAKEIAESHQEKWDGSGYPHGLTRAQIPVSARLMAIADVYDALISRRVYKAPLPHDQAMAIMVAGSGAHFDPDMVEALKAVEQEFLAISQRYSDDEVDGEFDHPAPAA